MSLKYATLGFLSYRPLSGYELKKAFDQSVRHFWPADQSQIYRTLKQLHRDELITQEVISREDRLDLKLYHITDSGKNALHRWLATPHPPSDTREPFLIQLYFSFLLDDSQVLHLIDTQLERLDEELEMFEQIYYGVQQPDRPEEEKRPFFYSMLTLEYGIEANIANRKWLIQIKERLQTNQITPRPFADLINQENET